METVNQENTTPENTQETEKTFSQAEVDRIVAERLSRERAKYPDYDAMKEKAAKFDQLEDASKTELQKATDKVKSLQAELDGLKKAASLREIRSKVSKETGVPEALLTGETEEACKEQAEAIKAFADPSYPQVKDGGESRPGNAKRTTGEEFADWFNNSFGK